jgi:shikimate dehydrogenase
MQNAAFAELGLNWRYLPLPVPPGHLEAALAGLAALGFRGVNVTVPHKQKALAVVERRSGPDAIASDARRLGAINTVLISRNEAGESTFRGRNTDLSGFIVALRENGFEPKSTRAVVVGAGGGARAVVFGLLEAGAESILVLNQTLERAARLVSDLGSASSAAQSVLQAGTLTQGTLVEASGAAQLLVNATPVGMWPNVDHSIWPEEVPLPSHLTVFDLVYNPARTKLLHQASVCGANGVGGLGMLVRQGALAFEMWTGEAAPLSVMRAACQQALQG